jgi:hypothetical protein
MSTLLLATAFISSAFATNYKGYLEETELTTKEGGITIETTVSDSDDLVTITLTGPSSVYYSVAFDSCKMKNSFALVVPGYDEDDNSVMEYKLGNDKKGDELDATFTTSSDSTVDSVRTVVLTRSLSDQDDLDSSKYYMFASNTTDLKVMWAYGTKGKYSQHDEAACGCVEVTFTSTEVTEMWPSNSWGQLFSNDSSFFFGQNPVSLLVVMLLLTLIMVSAAMYYHSKGKSTDKVLSSYSTMGETKSLINAKKEEEAFRIV